MRKFDRQTIKHTNPERWLTRSADIEGNGHVSVEWFLDWNELDWSRGSIVTPILRLQAHSHFPDHQSTRHKMSKISNLLHTPHYLQSCLKLQTYFFAFSLLEEFIIYFILKISVITEEAKCLASREALGNSPNCLAFSDPVKPRVIYWSGVTSSRLFLFSLRICLSSWAIRIASMFGMFLHLLGKSSWSTCNWMIGT